MKLRHNSAKCGYVALIGAPNAGKSTLLNCCLGEKLAIVSPKVQTTRSRILGVLTEGGSQIIFMDTPGIFNASKKFEKAMVQAAFSGAREADITLILVDVTKKPDPEFLGQVAGLPGRKALLLNKIDSVPREKLLPLAQQLFDAESFERCFMISALKGQGVNDLKNWLIDELPAGHWLFPEYHLTDLPQRFLAAETTREKVFLRLGDELPYQIAVETESWEEKPDGSVRIGQVIYVTSENHKKIVVGNKGATLKAIGQAARRDLEKFLGRKVHLFLFVKVSENWKEKKEFYTSIGLEF